MHPYVAGWIASDGHNAGKYWVITQNVDDIDVLKRIQRIVRESVLKVWKRKSGYGRKDMAVLRRASPDDCSLLSSEWGIPRGKKSYRLTFPSKSRPDTWMYLRGMFEGDGTISSEGGRYPRAQIISNAAWCHECKAFLLSEGICSYISEDKRHPGLSNIIIRRRNHVHKFMSSLYRREPSLRMTRKFSKWIRLAQSNPPFERERRFLSSSEREEVCLSLMNGVPVKAISTKYGINKNSIWIMKRELDGGKKVLTEKRMSIIEKLLLEGMSQRSIMAKVGCSSKLIKRVQGELK
jgi:hypothetical protein